MVVSAPREIRRRSKSQSGEASEGGLDLIWGSGEEVFLSARTLRLNCPCAECLAKQGSTAHDKPLTPGRSLLRVVSATVEQETEIILVWPIGNYAIGIRWGDNHDSGIYSFELLRKLSNEQNRNWGEEEHGSKRP